MSILSPSKPSTASVIAGTCSKEGHKSRALKIICARCLQNNQLQNVHNIHTISSIFDDAGQSHADLLEFLDRDDAPTKFIMHSVWHLPSPFARCSSTFRHPCSELILWNPSGPNSEGWRLILSTWQYKLSNPWTWTQVWAWESYTVGGNGHFMSGPVIEWLAPNDLKASTSPESSAWIKMHKDLQNNSSCVFETSPHPGPWLKAIRRSRLKSRQYASQFSQLARIWNLTAYIGQSIQNSTASICQSSSCFLLPSLKSFSSAIWAIVPFQLFRSRLPTANILQTIDLRMAWDATRFLDLYSSKRGYQWRFKLKTCSIVLCHTITEFGIPKFVCTILSPWEVSLIPTNQT